MTTSPKVKTFLSILPIFLVLVISACAPLGSSSSTSTSDSSTNLMTSTSSSMDSTSSSSLTSSSTVSSMVSTSSEPSSSFDSTSSISSYSSFDSSIQSSSEVSSSNSTPLPVELSAYYSSAEGLEGVALVTELHAIINQGVRLKTYGEARYLLDDTDADPNKSGNLLLIYLGTSVSGSWDSGTTWNREHVWPQSLLGVSASNGTANAASDLHNLKPSNPNTNSSRGNKCFDNIASSLTYVPRTEVRGDIARILFYMDIMYPHLTLVDRATSSTYQMGILSTLLQWHIDDPVDEFEETRNQVIYGLQKNRNPFIDYPHFVDLIW